MHNAETQRPNHGGYFHFRVARGLKLSMQLSLALDSFYLSALVIQSAAYAVVVVRLDIGSKCILYRFKVMVRVSGVWPFMASFDVQGIWTGTDSAGTE